MDNIKTASNLIRLSNNIKQQSVPASQDVGSPPK
nr:MAG TPA: hypothetical protein [Caudoviricetes sp.]